MTQSKLVKTALRRRVKGNEKIITLGKTEANKNILKLSIVVVIYNRIN